MNDASISEDGPYAAALASLGAGPKRLRQFLDGRSPFEAWEAISDGRHPADAKQAYRGKATPQLLESAARACERASVSVLILGRPGYPDALARDPDAPAVVFALGEPTSTDRLPRVAVVGTRSATPYGLGVASELGRGLAEAGVAVVSGLARGIDSAAHGGAVAAMGAPALGVMGTPLDAVLNGSQDRLRRQLAEHGAVLSELPPGCAGAQAWWFAIRNRVIAAMAHVVVVVESHLRGGALHTVKYALERSVPVAVVPGSVRSAASAGANALLVDGAAPVRGVGDVLSLVELSISSAPDIIRPNPHSVRDPRSRKTRKKPSNPIAARVLRALDHDPASLETLVRRCELPIGDVALALGQLVDDGFAENEGGWWSRPRR